MGEVQLWPWVLVLPEWLSMKPAEGEALVPGTLPSSSELSLSFSALCLGPSEVGCGLGGVERAMMKTQM